LQRGCGGSGVVEGALTILAPDTLLALQFRRIGTATRWATRMTDEIVFHHGTTMVRRLRLAPREAMPWHRDPFHRVAVVLGGDALLIEYRDGGETVVVQIAAGQVDWKEPSARVHRAVNVGTQP